MPLTPTTICSPAAYVLLEGSQARVAVTDLETLKAERTLPVAELLDRLGPPATFDDLTTVVGV